MFKPIDFYDDHAVVISTIGQGPRGDKGDKGDKGNDATQEQVSIAVSEFIEEHPEYVTTVEDGSVTSVKLASDAVTTQKIADNAVTSAKIADGSITARKLANDAVDAIPDMSSSRRGVARIGAGLAMNDGAIELDGNGDIATAVESWLDEHPEATTTVEDGSITIEKLHDSGMFLDSNSGYTGLNRLLIDTGWVLSESSLGVGKGVNLTTGKLTNNAARCRSTTINVSSTSIRRAVMIDDDTYMIHVFAYRTASASESTFIKRLTYDWVPAGHPVYIPDDIYSIVIMYKRVDENNMASEIDSYPIRIGTKAYQITDTSLTLKNKAADAYEVGQRLDGIESSISSDSRMILDSNSGYIGLGRLLVEMDWVLGSSSINIGREIDLDTGQVTIVNPARARSTTLNSSTSGRKAFMITDDTYEIQVAAYSAATAIPENYIGRLTYDWVPANHPVYIPDGIFAIAIMYKRVDEAEIDDTELDTLRYATKAYMLTDQSLSLVGKAADASIVGQRLDHVESVVESSVSSYQSLDDISLVPSCSGVISLYDDLVASHPDYVTKTPLTHGDLTLYQYEFSVADYNASQSMMRSPDQSIARPLLLITSGIHGYEQSSVMSLYGFCRALCESQYVQSRMIGLRIKVIPIVCPDGYDTNTRTNGNGVNINRNFAVSGWSESGSGTNDYTGPSAASEDETQIVQDWLLANSDASFFIDWHNSSYTSEVSCQLMIEPADEDPSHPSVTRRPIAKREYLIGIDTTIPHWMNDRLIDTTNTYGYTGHSSTGGSGTATRYAYEHGIVGATIETSWNVATSGKHSNFTIGVGTEAIVSILESMRSKTLALPEL